MNELLGLFGYEDKVNSTDTENLNLDNYTDSQSDTTAKDRKSIDTVIKYKTVDRLRIGLNQSTLHTIYH